MAKGTGLAFLKIGWTLGLNFISSSKSLRHPNSGFHKSLNSLHNFLHFSCSLMLAFRLLKTAWHDSTSLSAWSTEMPSSLVAVCPNKFSSGNSDTVYLISHVSSDSCVDVLATKYQ